MISSLPPFPFGALPDADRARGNVDRDNIGRGREMQSLRDKLPFLGGARYNVGMKTKTKNSPLAQMVEGLSRCLDPDSAKRVLKLRADAKLQKHIDQLADKCTEGTLTPDERAEYGEIVRFGTIIAMLKSKIRQRMAREGDQP
jgi:hypothetical protein